MKLAGTGFLAVPLILAMTVGLAAPVWLRAADPAPTANETALVPRRVTLAEAIAEARDNNLMLKAARREVDVSRGKLKEARSYFLPNLNFYETFSRTDNPVYVFMSKLTQQRFGMMDFAIDSLNGPPPLNNYSSKFEVTLPLFTGGKVTSGYRAAKMGTEAAQNKSTFAESTVTKAVTESFYGCLLAERAVAVMKETVKTAESHLKQVKAMHGQGLVLDSDLLRIRVFVADMKQKEVEREADAEVARAYLAYAMGTGGTVSPDGDFSPPSAPLPAFEEARLEALKQRGDVVATTLKAGQAGEGVKMTRADYLPQVGLVAAWEQDTERWTPETRGDNWMVGVQLKLPLFDGGARAGRLQAARGREFQARQVLLDLQQKVSLEVRSALLRAKAAAKAVEVTSDSERQARENLRIVSLRYKEGLASITDLLDADTALTAASLARAKSIHDELVERARLDWAMGRK